jgi:hypothetical protein
MSSNFAELAQVRVGEVERPKPVPEGHYSAVITGPMKEHKAKSGNFAMRFPFKLSAPGDDVDTDDLQAMGGLPDKEYTIDFWMSPDARWRFTEFGKSMGASDDLNLIELAEHVATCGEPFTIEAKHRANENDENAPPFIDWTNPVGPNAA